MPSFPALFRRCLASALFLGALAACHKLAPRPQAIALTPAWLADGEVPGSAFGTRAMCAGDVNGDGFDDLVVAAPHWGQDRGKIYVFLGGPQGLAGRPAWSQAGSQPQDRFGERVGQAGDVNGDGYDDVFAASPGWEHGLGRCVAFYGSPRGLGQRPDWSVHPDLPGQQFGDCTHPSGDIDGDGYDDLAVASYGFDGTRGQILLYRGSPRGLQALPSWEGRGEAKEDWYGYGVGTAGDVNGDGLDDLLAGAKYNDQGGRDAGKAYLYLGAPGAKLAAPAWTFSGSHAEANTSLRIATAGDINGDGFADVLVSAPGSNGKLGELYLFFGGPQGLKAQPDQTLRGPTLGLDYFGEGACPIGDVDGDGYDDVAVHGRDQNGRGHVLVYRGSPQGLGAWPTWDIAGEGMGDRFGWWVAPAGDVDGDGLADLVIGAESHGAGRAYVVYGRQFQASLPPIKNPGPARTRVLRGYLWKKKVRTSRS
jgi:hypothetical protein